MQSLTQLLPLYGLLTPFLLILFRVVGVFALFPLYSAGGVPARVRVLLALAVTLCMFNCVPHNVALPRTLPGLVLAIAVETSVGLLIGLLAMLVFTGLRLGANLLGQQMGLSLPSIYDPLFQEQSTSIEMLAYWVGVVTFLLVGGQRSLLLSLLYSFRAVPLGHSVSPAFAAGAIVGALQAACVLAISVAAPALASFFLALVVMGFLSRTVSQLNLMTISMPVNLLIGLGTLFLGISAWAWAGRHAWQNFFYHLARMPWHAAVSHG